MTTSKDSSPPPTTTTLRANIHLILLLVLIVVGAVLILTSLGNESYWDDEAFVATTARTLLRTGKLSSFDGRNLYTSLDCACEPSRFSACNPPLDELLTATSFRLAGISNTTGRLPFAIAGILTIIAFIFVLRFAAPKAEAYHLYAAAVLALSPCFLLYCRNCRYYALSMLFPVIAYLFYRRYLVTRKTTDLLLLTAAAVLLFYANYLSCALFLLSLGVVHIVFYIHEFRGKEWLRPIGAIMLFCALTLPYAVLTRAWAFSSPLLKSPPWLSHHALLLWWNFRDLNLHGCLPWVISASLAGVLIHRRRAFAAMHEAEKQVWSFAVQLVVILTSTVFFLGLLSPQNDLLHYADMRYHTIVLPWMAALSGAFIWYVHRKSVPVAILVLSLILTSNVLTLTPPELFAFFPNTNVVRLLLPSYIREISNPYPTGNAAVADFLKTNANFDDNVETVPNYEDTPVMLYAGDKVRICCQLDKLTNLPPKIIAKLHAPILIEDNFPKWIVAFGSSPYAVRNLLYFSRPHTVSGVMVRHRYKLVKALDVYFYQTNRPEIPMHTFGPVTAFDPMVNGIYIFEAMPDYQVSNVREQP